MRLETEIAMNDGDPYEMDAAVAALDALHSALTDDLEELEARIRTEDHSITQYQEARTSLHSALASIAEVLGWIQWKTEEEPDGELAVALLPLPTSGGYLIH
jgi:chromosome segregation ATPase